MKSAEWVGRVFDCWVWRALKLGRNCSTIPTGNGGHWEGSCQYSEGGRSVDQWWDVINPTTLHWLVTAASCYVIKNHRIMGYPKLETTHKDCWAQLMAHTGPPKIQKSHPNTSCTWAAWCCGHFHGIFELLVNGVFRTHLGQALDKVAMEHGCALRVFIGILTIPNTDSPYAVPWSVARRWWGDAGPNPGQAAQKLQGMAHCWPWRQPAPQPCFFMSVAVAHVWGESLPTAFLNRAWVFWLCNISSSCALLLISVLSGLHSHLGNQCLFVGSDQTRDLELCYHLISCFGIRFLLTLEKDLGIGYGFCDYVSSVLWKSPSLCYTAA